MTDEQTDDKIKAAYAERLGARIDKWDAQLDKLQAKAKEASADAEIKIRESIERIQNERDDLADQLKVIRQTSSEAWEGLKKEADDASRVLEEAFDRLRTQLSD